MSVATIIERISSAIGSGELFLAPIKPEANRITRLSDLLSDWEEVFPGHPQPEDGELRSVMDHGIIRRPKFIPRPRRSAAALPAPEQITASAKLISPALFKSVQGIYDYYNENGLGAGLIDAPFNEFGIKQFIDPLWFKLSEYWPLGCNLENLLHDGDMDDLGALRLILPHTTYDDSEAGIIEAFFSGADSIASLLDYYERENYFTELPAEDLALISHPGFMKLCENYEQYQGEKSIDIAKLYDCPNTYFAEVSEKYPQHMAGEIILISGGYGDDMEVDITSKDDIDFALLYAEKYGAMMDTLPDLCDFESNDSGTADELVHEMCEAWRKTHKQRSVKWANNKLNTISNRMKRGEL